MRRAGRRSRLAPPGVGRLQGADPQRLGGRQELRRPLGRRNDRSTVSQGVRRLSFVGAPRHRRDGIRGTRELARGAGRDRRGRARDHRVPRIALALILLAFGCEMRRARAAHATVGVPAKQEENFTAKGSPSLQFPPRQQEAPGWQLAEDPIVVPGNKLATYLDSDAAAFVSYGAMDLTAGNYNGAGNNGFATVEIYRFPDFVKAFGAYSLHKVQTAQYVNIENEAFVGKHSLNIWRGPFYVRITGGGTPDGNQGLLRLGQFVADRMPPAAGKPAVFNFLPTAYRVPNSERYSAQTGFGQPFLGNSFQATFNVDGAIIDGLIIPTANAQWAAKILDAYRYLY